jgi:cysteine desulfurase/selenocysteine lyase
MSRLNVDKIRKDFPILSRTVHGKALVYLDNAATLQKPQAVIDSLVRFYSTSNANVHRGVHTLSQEATHAYEGVRETVCQWLGTKNTREIIFNKGTTDGINCLATVLGAQLINEGDTIAVTRMEHHANFVPWQALCLQKRAKLQIIELTPELRIDPTSWKAALAMKPKIVAVSAMSNVSGAITDLSTLTREAHAVGAVVVADCAQIVAHGPLSIAELGGVDFLVFSSHKMGGPTGVGILWGKEEWLKKLPPYQFGGDMISRVGDQESKWNELPWKFEAGTPNFADVIAFGAALDYLRSIGTEEIKHYEESLSQHALEGLKKVPGLKLFGPASLESRGPVFSFALQGVHPHDLATFLDVEGIAVRAGHHCAQPLMNSLGVPATTRASLAFYNTEAEVDALLRTLTQAVKYFGKKKEGASHVS